MRVHGRNGIVSAHREETAPSNPPPGLRQHSGMVLYLYVFKRGNSKTGSQIGHDMLELAELFYVLVRTADHRPHDRCFLLEFLLGNGVQVDNIRAISKAHMADMRVKTRQLRVLAHTMSSMNLDRLVYDLQTHSRSIHFGHGYVSFGCLEPMVICLDGCQIAQQTGLSNLHACFRN